MRDRLGAEFCQRLGNLRPRHTDAGIDQHFAIAAGDDGNVSLEPSNTLMLFRRWSNGLPGGPSKQAALATALFVARVARLAWKAGGRPSH
jgi:hypothetical protein